MSFPRVAALIIIIVDLALGGLISNGFMVSMMIMEWTKCKRLGSSGQLLLSMGLSNICATLSVVVNSTILSIIPKSANSLWFQIIFFFGVTVTYFRFWLTAWLCVFYCIKIVNSTCSFILWCKQRISWLIPRLLLGALLISFLISSFSGVTNVMYTPMNATQSNRTGIVTNCTQRKEQTYISISFKVLFIIIGDGCLLVVALLCSILSIASLGRHLCHMVGGESSFQSFQTNTHIKAIGTMVSLLLLYVLLLLAQTLSSLEILKGELIHVLSLLAMFVYSSIQAVILVLANPKLRCPAIQILQRTQI